MIATRGYGGRCGFILTRGFFTFDKFYKTVSESIGVADKRLVASQTSFDGQLQSILTFILSDEYEDIEKVKTVWSERRNLKNNNY